MILEVIDEGTMEPDEKQPRTCCWWIEDWLMP